MQVRAKHSSLPAELRKLIAGLALGAGFGLLASCSWFGDTPPPPDGQTSGELEQTPDEEQEAPIVEAAPAKDKLRNDIVALVNDTPISVYDLGQRVALIMVTSGIPDTPDMRKKVRVQALEQLETELIQRQEAKKKDVAVSSVEVDKRIVDICEDSHITKDQLKDVLARGGVAMATFRAQIANQLLWQKAVQMEYAGRINIPPETVDAEMQRLAESADKVHYAVSEIFIAVDNPDQDDKAKQDILGLYEQIKSGAPFAAVARQFSQSPSAAQGGGIGLVYDGQMAPELNKALAAMKTGEVSEPIRATGGYYLLALLQRFEPYGTKVEQAKPEDLVLPASLPLARLLLPLGPHPSKELAENALRLAANLVTHISTCDTVPKIAKQIQGAVFMDLGSVRMADLSPQIHGVLEKTEPGSVAPPFVSDAGVEIFVRCDKAIPKLQAFTMPTREQIENQLFEEQISAMARRYNRDLKRSADIEVRTPKS
jgi:peptidyl-prolyl cis-trans isomerase SurA